MSKVTLLRTESSSDEIMTLKFKTETESLEEHTTMINGQKYKSCIFDIDQALRTKVKYTEDPLPTDWSELREWIRQIILDAECEDAL